MARPSKNTVSRVNTIPIDGDYVYEHCRYYETKSGISEETLCRDKLGRSKSFIHSACTYGAMNKATFKALVVITGMDEIKATKNPHPRTLTESSNERIEQGNSNDEIKKYYESLNNKIQWGNHRINNIPYMDKELRRVETKLDFIINELMSDSKKSELKLMLKENEYSYRGEYK